MATVLLRVPLENGGSVLVEADRTDVGEALTLATPIAGRAAAEATYTLASSLDELKPLLSTIKEKLAAIGPNDFTVEFGVKMGGETGIILAKGTAEVNLKITMCWTAEKSRD